MKHSFYRNEYSPIEWEALVDKAIDFGCKISYSKYGDMLIVDSTAVEERLMKRQEDRLFWAEKINGLIHDAARTPKRVAIDEAAQAFQDSEPRALARIIKDWRQRRDREAAAVSIAAELSASGLPRLGFKIQACTPLLSDEIDLILGL